jgi:hypothetical protein
MKTWQASAVVAAGCVMLAVAGLAFPGREPDGGGGGQVAQSKESPVAPAIERGAGAEEGTAETPVPKPKPISDTVHKGLDWLVKAQHENGGWGGGSHADQQNRDPHGVPVDPATTAFVASALLRAGHTPTTGAHKDAVRRATQYLCSTIEDSPAEDPKITTLTGTQPQSKLGPLVDTSMAAQYLARVLPALSKDDRLHARVDAALDRCLAKLKAAQREDGSWNVGGGWAPVLQSSLACSSLELAQVAGKPVDRAQLDKARDYQKGNFDTATGAVKAGDGAGIALYALSSAQRANAGEARAADDIVMRAKREGRVDADAPVSEESLRAAGVPEPQARKLSSANAAVIAQNKQLQSDEVLAGFGNNGGEEFLSYIFTSESLVITGGDAWKAWDEKMVARLAKIQNRDGSWSGHHCITSPVFCTAAVVQCLTTDRDAALLIQIAKNAAKAEGAGAVRTAQTE